MVTHPTLLETHFLISSRAPGLTRLITRPIIAVLIYPSVIPIDWKMEKMLPLWITLLIDWIDAAIEPLSIPNRPKPMQNKRKEIRLISIPKIERTPNSIDKHIIYIRLFLFFRSDLYIRHILNKFLIIFVKVANDINVKVKFWTKKGKKICVCLYN